MQTKTKKIIFLVGAIFVAIIFLTSYAAFSNNNTSGTTTTSTVKQNQPTFFATGSASAVITNYTQVATVRILNDSNSTNDAISNLMSQLESNGSVDNYIYSNGSYDVYLATISPYGLQSIFDKSVPANAVSVGSTADITLPASINMFYPGTVQPINVPLSSRNYSLYLSTLQSLNSTINVSISALITETGQVYENQMRISYMPASGNKSMPGNTITGNSITTNSITTNSVTGNSIAANGTQSKS
jgi:hypothetical protein